MCAALLGLMLVCSTMIFSAERCPLRPRFPVEQRGAVISAVEPNVQIPVPGDFDTRNAFDRAPGSQQFRRDRLGGFLQLPRELERRRQRNFAE
jgi:hypothetical protein